jgi:hypothetical protein
VASARFPFLERLRPHRGHEPCRTAPGYDHEREQRAEARARELLRSCVNAEEWSMYDELGFIRFRARCGDDVADGDRPRYAYLIYPHKPLVAYVPHSGRLLSEYCVEFRYRGTPDEQARLPAADDVLAKWLALSADEPDLIARANVTHLGRQIDPDRVRRDLSRLASWEREHSDRDRRVG